MSAGYIPAVRLDKSRNCIVLLDQTCLPRQTKLLEIRDAVQLHEAIRSLRVRGAPAIGVAAAFGMYLAAKASAAEDARILTDELCRVKAFLDSARPTAVNLSWATERMLRVCRAAAGCPAADVKSALLREAILIRNEDASSCRAIGEHALSLVKPGDGILTHCNAGRLAAGDCGTATAVMYLGAERGYGLRVYADETRPLLQGARLTAYELMQAGIDVTLICDGMCASVMRRGLIDAVFVGADRIAANGDTANKVGTAAVAAAAHYHHIPFYVCAPISTVDMSAGSGDSIVIEERDSSEITEKWYAERMAPDGVKVFNPAFDITDAELITAIVTERGIARAPFGETLAALTQRKG